MIGPEYIKSKHSGLHIPSFPGAWSKNTNNGLPLTKHGTMPHILSYDICVIDCAGFYHCHALAPAWAPRRRRRAKPLMISVIIRSSSMSADE